MLRIKTFDLFLEKKNIEKTIKTQTSKIEDLIKKSKKKSKENGITEDEELIKLATKQADKMKDIKKVHYRGVAAEEMGFENIAKIYYNAYDKLLKLEINKKQKRWKK
jgi:hypothetical protein